MKLSSLTLRLFIALIRIYQRLLSPLLGRLGVRCRFHPTCSEYGILAIQKYGPVMGLLKALKRIARCRRDSFESCIDYP
jgi:putative membrane protein insertion efficiency factor